MFSILVVGTILAGLAVPVAAAIDAEHGDPLCYDKGGVSGHGVAAGLFSAPLCWDDAKRQGRELKWERLSEEEVRAGVKFKKVENYNDQEIYVRIDPR